MSGKYLHVRCAAHIVNLIVKEGLKEQDCSIQRIRNAMKFVRSSPQRSEKFQGCVLFEKISCKKGVCLDVETRWNSTYLMLDTAIKYKKAFNRLQREDNGYRLYFDDYETHGRRNEIIGPPNGVDWSKAEAFVKFLKLFYVATLAFSDSNYVTVRNDPSDCEEYDCEDTMSFLDSQFAMKLQQEESLETKCELTRYLHEACEKDPRLNILQWWKSNSFRYPILSKVAKDVLAIPVSTVASEQSFSTSGRILNEFRSLLKPKTVEMLVCAQNWFRSDNKPIDIREMMDDVEKYEEILNESSTASSSVDA